MITFLIFIIVIGILILVHELGHFISARWAKMKVEEFAIGFPPKIWSKKKGDTVYSINAVPFGGLVKIYGEEGDKRGEGGSFTSKSFLARFGVIAAGVAMNFFFAILLLMIGNALGLRIGLDTSTDIKARDIQVQIIQVASNSPAEKAGIQVLDSIEGFKMANSAMIHLTDIKTIQEFVSLNVGQPLTILIKRGGQEIEKVVEPRKNPPQGEGALGISLLLTGVVSYPWYDAIWRGVYDGLALLVNTAIGYWIFFKTLFTTGHLISDVSGPIGIATLTGRAAKMGFTYLLQFTALISVNLAVLNFIPFPALDGGRALLLLM